jgi:threonine dehydrogenase-like Zn-dependent dehydrogenase
MIYRFYDSLLDFSIPFREISYTIYKKLFGDFMEKIIATAPGTFIRENITVPVIQENEVLVRTQAIGICGSDIHLFRGDHPYTTYPMVFGHEAAGVVEQTSQQVSGLQRGDHVVLEPLIPCGVCYPCSIGRSNCCSKMKTVGVTCNGALSELFAVPATCLHAIPSEMPFELAALAEPFSIGFQAAARGNISAADSVLIIGAGTIGLTALSAAKAHGARVMISDILDYRLDLARKMGADHTINSSEKNLKESAMKWNGGIGPSVVIEAVGLPATLESAVDIVSDAGRVVVVGVTKERFCIRGVDVTKKELSIIGSRNNLGRFREALDYVASNPQTAQLLISHSFPFSQAEQAFDHANTHPESTCKVMITF